MTASMARRTSIERVYQLDIRLTRIDPPIWRRIVASDQITLAALHHLLQVVMGWEHSHLHQFLVGEMRYGEPDPDYDDDMQSDRRVRLRDIAREKGASFRYEYDFGDGWMHLITVEEMWPRTDLHLVPRCTEGARACPPEDCGGVGGYESLLEALRDRRHPEHRELRAWAGKHFDPELFFRAGGQLGAGAPHRAWRDLLSRPCSSADQPDARRDGGSAAICRDVFNARLLQSLRNACQHSHVLDVVATISSTGSGSPQARCSSSCNPTSKPSRSVVYANPHQAATSLTDQLPTGSSRHRLPGAQQIELRQGTASVPTRGD